MYESAPVADGEVAPPQHTSPPDVLSTPQPETVLNTALENRAAGVSTRWLSIGGHQGVPRDREIRARRQPAADGRPQIFVPSVETEARRRLGCVRRTLTRNADQADNPDGDPRPSRTHGQTIDKHRRRLFRENHGRERRFIRSGAWLPADGRRG